MQSNSMDKEMRAEFRAWKIEIEDMLRQAHERIAVLEGMSTPKEYSRKAKQETASAASGNGE